MGNWVVKLFNPKKDMRILMVGLDAAGKVRWAFLCSSAVALQFLLGC
jgi:ADP-ribosylation factor family